MPEEDKRALGRAILEQEEEGLADQTRPGRDGRNRFSVERGQREREGGILLYRGSSSDITVVLGRYRGILPLYYE